MKTITEFPALNLKNAAKIRAELTASGKTAEELPAALGEALKLEGDKLTFMVAALDLIGTRHDDLKRVIVSVPREGEKPPTDAKQVGEHFYSVEFHPSLNKPAPQAREGGRDDRRGGRDGKRGGRGGGGRGGRDGDRKNAGGPGGPGGDRGPRAPQGPRPASAGPVSLPKPRTTPIAPLGGTAPQAAKSENQDSPSEAPKTE